MEKTMNEIADRELRIIKVLNAPVGLVWEAWSKPEHIAKWWGPDGFITTIHKMDLREGGEWLLTIRGPDGKNYPNKSIFGDIIPHRKFVYQHFNPKFLGTVVFDSRAEQTVIEWTMLFESKEMFNTVVNTFKADEGQKQNVEKLEKYLQEMKAH